jgi:hypothetical protein
VKGGGLWFFLWPTASDIMMQSAPFGDSIWRFFMSGFDMI